jgi:mRNA interferase RelE/StbE
LTGHTVTYSARAIRQIRERLPEKIAAAVVELIEGPLTENPRRIGKPLLPPLERYYGARRGEYRVVYEIFDDVDRINIVDIAHRRGIYRRR